jgi:hypothetical protein
MGRLDVDFIRWTDNSSATWEVPVEELRTRVIQYYTAQYTGGDWNPNNSYNWIPGAYTNFTPRRANSRINFKMRLPMAWVAASHAIQNFIFYANGVNYWAWSETGTHHENGKTYQFEVPSWGAGATAAIGIQSRSHADDNHEQRMYRTYYWNGGGSVQNCYGQLFIEERMS